MAEAPPCVRDLMQTALHTLKRNDPLTTAEDLMKQARIRHLPVLDADDRLCGIVSQRDLFRGMLLRSLGFGTRAEDRLLADHVVKEAMIKDVVTVSPETPLADAAKLMLDRKIGCLPVVAGNDLVGILTEADFVAHYAGG
ncbi:MAG: CBS domain-containing protein [Pseudomonadota bacterium]